MPIVCNFSRQFFSTWYQLRKMISCWKQFNYWHAEWINLDRFLIHTFQLEIPIIWEHQHHPRATWMGAASGDDLLPIIAIFAICMCMLPGLLGALSCYQYSMYPNIIYRAVGSHYFYMNKKLNHSSLPPMRYMNGRDFRWRPLPLYGCL